MLKNSIELLVFQFQLTRILFLNQISGEVIFSSGAYSGRLVRSVIILMFLTGAGVLDYVMDGLHMD